MKKIVAYFLAAAMVVVMLGSAAGCNQSSGEPVRYDIGSGLSIVLPDGMQEIGMNGFAKVLANDKFGVYFIRESVDDLAAVNLGDVTLEEYAELSAATYGRESGYTADENGHLVTTYNADVDGKEFHYYTTLREGSDCFWTINFVCEEDDRDIYADLFARWNDTITVE